MELFHNKKLWMPDMIEDGLLRGGSRTFAFFTRADGSVQEVSYDEIRSEGIALLERLKNAGVRKGDRLAVVSAMRPWWYSVLYAALLGGFRMVCIDPGVPELQIQSMMRRTEVRAVLTTSPALKLPVTLNERIPVYSVEPGFPLLSECATVDKLLGTAEELPEDTFFILFSSGTTGETRKGVLLPHTSVTVGIEYGMANDSGVFRRRSAYTVRKRDLMLFPPYHIAGLLCAVYDIYCNTEIIMLERLTPGALSGALQSLKPDNICTVPSMLTILMKKIKAGVGESLFGSVFVNALMKLSGFFRRYLGWNIGRGLLRFLNRKALGGKMAGFMIGGAPCDAETMRFFLNMGIDVSIAYGLTELGAPLACTGPGYYPGTTGRVLRHTPAMDIRTVNPDEKGRGEVEILSPMRMISYLNPDDNEGCFTEDGYFRSGDLGYYDSRDCLVLCGRAKEAIVFRNGEKLLPEEIEAQYEGVKDIGELAVFRVPDEGGCDTFSIAVTKATNELPDELIRLHVLDRVSQLSGNFVPKEVYVVHQMPYSSSHKVQRFRLTEMAMRGDSNPENEDSLRRVDEDSVVSELRELLISAGGSQWKTVELTEGLLLNLDSLQTMDLLVAVQEHFGIDLFTLAKPPVTFGELLNAVNHFDEAEKREKSQLNLSEYPLPTNGADRLWGRTLRGIIRTRYHVYGSGLKNIPENDTVLFCANHISALDPGFISTALGHSLAEKTAVVGKRDVMDSKLLRGFAKAQNMIPVDRSGNSMATLDRCRELLGEGWHVLIFPEGTNYENATCMLKFKEGPARLSIATGKAIVPVHIKGVARVNSNDTGLLPPVSERVDVVFGKPIDPGEMTPAELNDVLKDAINAL